MKADFMFAVLIFCAFGVHALETWIDHVEAMADCAAVERGGQEDG